jgi:C-terminal processing protease CtpA/Prc
MLQFTVNDILKDSPASFSQIQIGDRLRMVSSACEDSASAAQSEQAQRLKKRRKKREKVSCDIPRTPNAKCQNLSITGEILLPQHASKAQQ